MAEVSYATARVVACPEEHTQRVLEALEQSSLEPEEEGGDGGPYDSLYLGTDYVGEPSEGTAGILVRALEVLEGVYFTVRQEPGDGGDATGFLAVKAPGYPLFVADATTAGDPVISYEDVKAVAEDRSVRKVRDDLALLFGVPQRVALEELDQLLVGKRREAQEAMDKAQELMSLLKRTRPADVQEEVGA